MADPPDCNGAVGPGYFVEFINGEFAAYPPDDVSNVFRQSDIDFWTFAGVSIASDEGITDPRVIYDSASQRWFASMVDYDANTAASGGDYTLEANNFLIAVSTSSDPTGSWTAFRFRADTNHNSFADFPTLGVDSNAVYLSGDMYKGTNNPLGASLVSIPKADLIADTPTVTNRTFFGVLDHSTYGWVLQPASCFDGSSSGTILAMGNMGSDTDFHSNLVTFAVQNGGASGATLSVPDSISVNPYMVPYDPNLGIPWMTVNQPDGTQTLDANDGRISAKVYSVGGVLYAVHSTYFNDRVAVQWYRINATNDSILEQGMIADPDLDLYFPSIAANPGGTVVICCNGSSVDTTNSIYAYVGQTINGVTTFENPILLLAGALNYHGFDEIINGNPESRWGDFTSLSVDPANPTHFWTIQMFSSGEDDSYVPIDPSLVFNVWSTQITELIVTALAPQLIIAPSGANVLISWPSSATGFQLQSNTNLSSTNWVTITPTLSTNGSTVSTLVPRFESQNFFRLKQ